MSGETRDVAEILNSGEERDLVAVWDWAHERQIWQRVIAKWEAVEGDEAQEHVRVATAALAGLPEVTPLQALAASRRLVELLTGRRWYVMRNAREAGDSWNEIGVALGMSRQAAWDWYKRTIADHEKYAGDFHESARARAALNDGTDAEAAV